MINDGIISIANFLSMGNKIIFQGYIILYILYEEQSIVSFIDTSKCIKFFQAIQRNKIGIALCEFVTLC